MVWEQIKVLMPSMIGHLIVSVAFFAAAWWLLKKVWVDFAWPVQAACVLGGVLSVFSSINTMTQIYQATAIGRAAQAQQAQNGQQSQMTEEQMRGEFVKAINQLVSNPQQVTPEVKKQFASAFAPILTNEKLKNTYLGNVANIFTCQKLFLTDAMESMKKKKEVKTADRVTCETLAGEFFGRKTLIPEEAIASNLQLIKDLSSSRKPASGDRPLPTETELKSMIQQQDVSLQVIQFLFN